MTRKIYVTCRDVRNPFCLHSFLIFPSLCR